MTHIWFLGVQRRAEFALYVIPNSMSETDRNYGAAGKKVFKSFSAYFKVMVILLCLKTLQRMQFQAKMLALIYLLAQSNCEDIVGHVHRELQKYSHFSFLIVISAKFPCIIWNALISKKNLIIVLKFYKGTVVVGAQNAKKAYGLIASILHGMKNQLMWTIVTIQSTQIISLFDFTKI